MNHRFYFMAGFFLCSVLFVACASVFPYERFGMQMPEPCYDQGVLLGPEEDGSEDKPMTLCKPDDQQTGKCLVIRQAEWARLKADYIELEERLKDCEKNC